jgi:tRNA (guanine37-N1)-methyltransferase
MASWQASVLTLFPEMFPGPLGMSLAGRALAGDVWRLSLTNIRDFATDKHRSVDDTPAGGGAGMVMRADIAAAAIDASSAELPGVPRIYLSPRGTPLTQARVHSLASGPGVIVFCGRFEGLDERVIQTRQLEEISIGDYVLSGGELAAMVLIDACVRLLPGVIGAEASLAEESFEAGLLEYPHYTRPRLWEGLEIPGVLLSGDHARIARWRLEQSERHTAALRPDLVQRKPNLAGVIPALAESPRSLSTPQPASSPRRVHNSKRPYPRADMPEERESATDAASDSRPSGRETERGP